MTARAAERCLQVPEVTRLLIVDNGSGEEDPARLAELEGDRAELVALPTNLGYAGGMQSGIEAALQLGADFVWLLNNDCEVEPSSLRPLLEEMRRHPKTAACSGMVLHRRWIHGGGTLSPWSGMLRNAYTAQKARSQRYEVDFVPGIAWLLRASVIREIGGLDCRLFLIGEEPDWCHRASLRGYRAVIVPEASIRAEESATLGRYRCEPHFYVVRNGAWLVRRQRAPIIQALHGLLLICYRLPRMIVARMVRGEMGCIPLVWRAVQEGLTAPAGWSDDPQAALANRLPAFASPGSLS